MHEHCECVERLTGALDATERQLAARNGENAGERLWHAKADDLQARLDKVRAILDDLDLMEGEKTDEIREAIDESDQ